MGELTESELSNPQCQKLKDLKDREKPGNYEIYSSWIKTLKSENLLSFVFPLPPLINFMYPESLSVVVTVKDVCVLFNVLF